MRTLFIVLICLSILSVSAQEEEFTPSGSGFATIFANYHQGITDAAKNESAFELVRGYLGYEYNLSPEFYGKINLDIGSPEDLSDYAKDRRYAYFKNAYLRYSKNNVQVEFGLIGLKQFKLQEGVWERRYLMKTLADEYRFGSSADLGINFHYKFSEIIDADFTIMNGEGYNNIQTDGIFKYGVGSTIRLPKNFTSRVFYDFTYDEIWETTILGFASYDFNGKANIAGEFVYRKNDTWTEGRDRYGYSIYGKYNLTDKYQLFARYDQVSSVILEGENRPWNLVRDGSAIKAGIQFRPIRNIKMALNYHDWVPYAANSPTRAFIYLDLEVKL